MKLRKALIVVNAATALAILTPSVAFANGRDGQDFCFTYDSSQYPGGGLFNKFVMWWRPCWAPGQSKG